ncbi:XRE family transcriptional regulator [Pseudomonas sp. MWU12-2115]|uniref:helix-turn-helix domain-containing protein n=1 Tax=unclassified Pseudomonas TaxID=196821 RepID=UPI000CD52C4B|nr:helix-turn-helix transcriptional regulator [Pseudomonas sp. MWU12-2020]RBB97343.1 XRE family transcriptional regulator [Pseudomonas sp. MWU12-2115]
MKPDARHHNPDPRYLRGLLDKAGISRSEAARLIGMSRTGFNHYLRDESEPLYREASYPVQFALECLAEAEASIESIPQGGNHGETS